MLTAVSNNSPVNPGATVTWTTAASDSTDSDTVKLLVCKTQGISAGACDGGASDTWCSSSLVASNPSCGYAVPAVSPDGSNNAYVYIVDQHNFEATGASEGSNVAFTINNVAPVVSAVTINGGVAINLTESSTKAVAITATITDNNSCDGTELSTIYGYAYRSGIAYTGCDTAGEANNNSCYPEISCTQVGGSCTGNTDASADYTCTVNLQYYADPTDVATQYPTENWLSTVKATDNNSASANTQVSSGVELNSLVAFTTTSAINYGSLGIGESNNPLNKPITITPTGNVGLDLELSGSANMCTDFPTCSGSTIPVGNQKYALEASISYSSGTSLTTTPAVSPIHIHKPWGNIPESKNIWWGILVPESTNPGTYNGSITATGVKSSTSYWYVPYPPTNLQMSEMTFQYDPQQTSYCSIYNSVYGSAIFEHINSSQCAISYQLQFSSGIFGGTDQAYFLTEVAANTRSEDVLLFSGYPFDFPEGSHWWKIRMWDANGNVSDWSQPSYFSCISM